MPSKYITVIVAPSHTGGTLGRIVEFPDGSFVTEVWNGSKWVPDMTKVVSVLKGKRAGMKTLNNFGIPASDRTRGELMERRREERLARQLPVQMQGVDYGGNPFVLHTLTTNISGRGARLHYISCLKGAGESIDVQRGREKARFHVVWIGRAGTPQDCEIGICCLESMKNFWGGRLSSATGVAESGEERVAPTPVSLKELLRRRRKNL